MSTASLLNLEAQTWQLQCVQHLWRWRTLASLCMTSWQPVQWYALASCQRTWNTSEPSACSSCQQHPAEVTFDAGLRLQSRVDGQLLLDPTNEEASREDGSLVLALLPSRNMVRLHCQCLCEV